MGLRPANFHEEVGEPGCRRAGRHGKPAEAGCGQNWPPHSVAARQTTETDRLSHKAASRKPYTPHRARRAKDTSPGRTALGPGRQLTSPGTGRKMPPSPASYAPFRG